MANKFNVGTILRLLLSIWWRGDGANANMIARVGCAIVSDDALALAAVPTPLSDPAYGWYMNAPLIWDEPTITWLRSDFDIRTARKLVGDASTLMIAVENGTSTGFLQFGYGARILYQKK